jgi:ubiquinone/menaquinone biosynthesis C-methylase UbiE/DnaJ-domain-containing protein 1
VSDDADRELTAAAQFCARAEAADLFEFLGLPKTAAVDEALGALSARRTRLQSQQANPKYRDVAVAFIKAFPELQRVLADPAAHLRFQSRRREADKLPLLELAIDSVLADGVVTSNEEAFVRERAIALGISKETYERVLAERAEARGISLADASPGVSTDATVTGVFPAPSLLGAHASWWSPLFTRLLLDHVPSGPGEIVDIYCRNALSAVTLLPARRQVKWLGLDANADRLAETRRTVRTSPRMRLAHARADHIPLVDGTVDVVLSIRALQHFDPDKVLEEAARVLAPGGRIIAVEPDDLAETFVFDAHLVGINRALHALLAAVHAAGAAHALGPRLGRLLERHGFEDASVLVHTATHIEEQPWSRVSRKLKRYPVALAQQAGLTNPPELAALMAEVAVLDARMEPGAVGLGGHNLPLYLWSARRAG